MKYQNGIETLHFILREFFEEKGNVFQQAVDHMAACLENKKKILAFGNGGSAAQAQHFAAELVNRFLKDRRPFPAVSLTTDTSALTSIANDSRFDFVFSRQVEALGEKGDVALALSTSGRSPNIIEGVRAAGKGGLYTVALTGKGGGPLAPLADCLLDIPSVEIPRIQEAHLFLLHLLAGELEELLVPSD
ncbi:MAG: SIS domain-containing protein [Candidatus Aminicenantes bacterium]|nr:SIS domain-containing protein [Candidatus Aminicenantes bacterium]